MAIPVMEFQVHGYKISKVLDSGKRFCIPELEAPQLVLP